MSSRIVDRLSDIDKFPITQSHEFWLNINAAT